MVESDRSPADVKGRVESVISLWNVVEGSVCVDKIHGNVNEATGKVEEVPLIPFKSFQFSVSLALSITDQEVTLLRSAVWISSPTRNCMLGSRKSGVELLNCFLESFYALNSIEFVSA